MISECSGTFEGATHACHRKNKTLIKAHAIARVATHYLIGTLTICLVFAHCSYARFYLRTVLLTPLSLLHYFLVGRKLGHRPNALFDPEYFATKSNGAGFFKYVMNREFWSIAPSIWLEPGRLALTSGIHPLIRCWMFGDRAYARHGFDKAFVKSSICRDRFQKNWMLFQVAARPGPPLPMTRGALLDAQCTYRSPLSYKTVRYTKVRRRRFLVFVQAGAQFDSDILNPARDYDVLLNYYDRMSPAAERAEIVTCQPGTKTTAVANVMRNHADLLLRYDAVLFLDDDVEISREQIDRLFAVFEAEGLDLAQPSLTSHSSCYFSCLKQPVAGSRVQHINGVEIMMPIISQRVLRTNAWVFSEGVSGWGVDLLLSAKVREQFGDVIALIGDVVVTHDRPVDTEQGALYKILRFAGIDANSEAGDIVRRHRLPLYAQRIRPIPTLR